MTTVRVWKDENGLARRIVHVDGDGPCIQACTPEEAAADIVKMHRTTRNRTTTRPIDVGKLEKLIVDSTERG